MKLPRPRVGGGDAVAVRVFAVAAGITGGGAMEVTGAPAGGTGA
jgi:hypothetical protein